MKTDGLKPETLELPLVRGFDHSVSLPVLKDPWIFCFFLIRKNEIDIYDIPVGRITSQYLDFLRNMEHQRLEVAGEFFVMAATLMQIKSRLLLPKDEQLAGEDDPEEASDPRWELVQQLIEYKKFKEAAGRLDLLMTEARDTLFRDYFLRSDEQPERPLMPADALTIWNVFNQVLRRLSEKIVIGQIHDETVTISDRMEVIIEEMKQRPRLRFSELITGPVTIPFIIATFLALLELTRLKKLTLEQNEDFADIECQWNEE